MVNSVFLFRSLPLRILYPYYSHPITKLRHMSRPWCSISLLWTPAGYDSHRRQSYLSPVT